MPASPIWRTMRAKVRVKMSKLLYVVGASLVLSAPAFAQSVADHDATAFAGHLEPDAAFAEINIPILKDMPFFQDHLRTAG